jgi:hypothetical protein
MSWWLKRVHWTDARENADYWRKAPLITDAPGRRSGLWSKRARPSVNQVLPPYGPQYAKGDKLVICIANTRGCPPELVRRCPAVLEVDDLPRWDPALVDRAGSRPREGDRWGVVTNVTCLNAVEPRVAPMVESIGVMRSSLNQKGYRHLEDEQGDEAQRLLKALEAGTSRRKPLTKPAQKSAVQKIPIEQGKVEAYDVSTKKAVVRARREESKLVADYSDYLVARGQSVCRQKIKVPDNAEVLYTDLFNETRRQLIEAKAGISRSDVRMAIGQLADYARFIKPVPQRAILLEAMPTSDIHRLLRSQGVATIWRDGTGFLDDAGGRFT